MQVLAFANFGTALRSSADSGKGGSDAVLDYSKQELSISSEAREKVCVPMSQYESSSSLPRSLHTHVH